ncbi:MAG TPA: hypothetical protein VNS63_18370 [Blastocatellia bacterium]|nr:hypothetical protein [Blastocatellia bacterium]
MQNSSSLFPRTRARVFVTFFLCGLLVVAASVSAPGQSGRRPPKQPSSTDTKPPASTEPPVQPSTPAATLLPILVVKNLPNVGSSSILTGIALDGCLEELKQSRAVQVSSSKDKTRKEASDYAKTSKDTYVVLIELEQEVAATDRPNVSIAGGDPRSLLVSYVVFTPVTGKVATQGRVYQGQRQGPLGRVPTSNASVDYELRICGREVADRVLDALKIARPQRQ